MGVGALVVDWSVYSLVDVVGGRPMGKACLINPFVSQGDNIMKRSNCLKTALMGASVGATVIALSLGTAVAGEFDGVTLRVGTWGGSWKQVQVDYIVPQLAAKGMKIEFVTAGPNDNIAKLVAAKGRGDVPIDVMEVGAPLIPLIEEGKFAAKIDHSLVPNKADMPASLYNDRQFVTLTAQYGIAYEKQKFADLGIPPPQTLQDLTHPKLKRKVGFPDIASGPVGWTTVAMLAQSAGGGLENITPGLDLLNKIDAFAFFKRLSASVTHMETGDIYAALVHAGWGVRMKKAGLNVGMVYPKLDDDHTGAVAYTMMIVVTGTKVAKAATAFLNEYISEEFQFQLAKQTGVVPVNKHAIARMQDVPLLQEMMVLDRAKMDRMVNYDFSQVDISGWMDEWQRSIKK